MENKSQEILHHLGTQKYAKLCLKCIKIRLEDGLRPGPLGEILRSPRPPSRNQGVPKGPTSTERERKGREGGLPPRAYLLDPPLMTRD